MSELSVKDLVGKTLSKVEVKDDGGELWFTTVNGEQFRLYHSQDCCETVEIESVVGDLEDLVGEPLLLAEESISDVNPEGVVIEYQDSFTWTFYKFATRKGYVDVRWYGSSNGYYSERVDFERVTQ